VYGVFRTDGGPPPVPEGFDTMFEAPGLALLERPGCLRGTLSRRGDSALYLFGEIHNVQDVWPASDGTGDDLVSLHELLASSRMLELLPRLNGSFFIAACDQQARRLRLIADRCGSQTCFYAFRDGVLRFFPRLGDFLGAGFRARLDRDLMLPFLAMRCICGPRTVVEDAFLVPQGCVVEASHAGVGVRRYWSWQFDESRDDLDDPRAAVRELGDLWVRAVERRTRGRERVVLQLSGGFDSRAILAALLECRPAGSILAVTLGTPGTFDYELGRLVAEAAGVRHRAIDITGPKDYEQEYLRKAIDIDGTGDVFWGFLSDYDPLAELTSELIVGLMGGVLSGKHAGRNALAERPADEKEALEPELAHRRFTPLQTVSRLCGMTVADCQDRILALMAGCNEGNAHRLSGNFCLVWDFVNRQTPYVQPLVCKLRETFRYLAPFLDNDLVDFILRVPLRWRTGQRLWRRMYVERFPALAALPTKNLKGRPLLESWPGWLGWKLARVLRRQVETLSFGAFPLASAHREQMRRRCVQNLDYDRLLRESALLRTMVEAKLGRLAERGVLDGDTIQALWAEHVSGEAGHVPALVALASIELVLEAFVDRAVSQAGGSSSSRR